LSSAGELGEVCARLVAAADGELRRIERALHDGVQQDLIAVSVRLQLARRLADTDFPAAMAVLDEIGRDVRIALDGVRGLANEIYPSVLEARGLPDALRSAASAAGVAATVEAAGAGRYPAEVEAAVYFFCRAALEAVAAHASADTRVGIEILEKEEALRLVVDCEGAGLEAAADQLSSARDRIEALGGVLSFESAVGATRLEATVPLG
jgi:signal transduction histidine kinase